MLIYTENDTGTHRNTQNNIIYKPKHTKTNENTLIFTFSKKYQQISPKNMFQNQRCLQVFMALFLFDVEGHTA